MVVFKNVSSKLFQLLSTKRTSVMAIDSLLNAPFAVNVATSRNVTVVDRIETNCASELGH